MDTNGRLEQMFYCQLFRSCLYAHPIVLKVLNQGDECAHGNRGSCCKSIQLEGGVHA